MTSRLHQLRDRGRAVRWTGSALASLRVDLEERGLDGTVDPPTALPRDTLRAVRATCLLYTSPSPRDA